MSVRYKHPVPKLQVYSKFGLPSVGIVGGVVGSVVSGGSGGLIFKVTRGYFILFCRKIPGKALGLNKLI